MPGFTGLKQNYYLLKILQPELDLLLIWLGIIHAIIDMWRPNLGWPPKKAGVIGIAGTQLDIVSLQIVSLVEKLDLFTWWLGAPRGWKQKLRVHAQRWNSTTFTPSICQSKVPGQGKYPPPAGSAKTMADLLSTAVPLKGATIKLTASRWKWWKLEANVMTSLKY